LVILKEPQLECRAIVFALCLGKIKCSTNAAIYATAAKAQFVPQPGLGESKMPRQVLNGSFGEAALQRLP